MVDSQVSKAQRLRRKSKQRAIRSKILFPYDKLSYQIYFRIFDHDKSMKSIAGVFENDRILLLSPHQDDEVLGCGGFLLSCRGVTQVQPVIITSGNGPNWARSENERIKVALIRSTEASAVCKAMGTRQPINLGFDGSDIQGRNQTLVEQIAAEIKCFKPTVVMAPFFTDANKEHTWITRNLAQVPIEAFNGAKVLLYRVHGQIPQKFQNMFFGLSSEAHTEKEKILSLYKSQLLDQAIVREKYLLYSEMVTNKLSNRYRSIERYCYLKYSDFIVLDKIFGKDKYLTKLRSINYAPYSFRCFIMNEVMFLFSSFVRKGSAIIGQMRDELN